MKEIKLSDVAKLFQKSELATICKLQRHYGIGYGFASKIVDYLEEQGVVSRQNPQRPVIDHEKLEALAKERGDLAFCTNGIVDAPSDNKE